MKWNNFNYKDIEYDLTHLHPFEWSLEVPASEKRPKAMYKFYVVFSMHCFTRKALSDESVEDDLWYSGPKERRVFCFNRYEYSKLLPDIIKALGERPCWHTHGGNYFTIEILNAEGEKIEYEIYFDVTKAGRRGWLHLTIQSAYARTPEYKTTQPRKRRIRFHVIAYNTQMRKPTKPPK